jgi:hypothetical protein
MMRVLQSPVLKVFALALGVSLGLGGCASGGMLDQLPTSLGGEPAGVPARPKDNQYQFPAVHDMPPARATAPLGESEQFRLEKELQAARDRQQRLYGSDTKPEPTAKKKPADPKNGQTSGAKTNP